MDISELSLINNIPLIKIIDFFSSHNHDVDTYNPITDDQLYLFNTNLEKLKADTEENSNRQSIKMEIQRPKIEGPKIISKIDLSSISAYSNIRKTAFKTLNDEENKQGQDNQSKPSNIFPTGSKLPRLLAAAKEFNVGQDTIVDFLVGKGYNKDELKPTAKLTEEMYIALVEFFHPDKVAKLKSDLVQIPKGNVKEERNHLEGFIEDISHSERVKIAHILYERIHKNGKVVILEKPDKTNYTFAIREYWTNYNFVAGEKIFFSLQLIDRNGIKIRVAMPPIEQDNATVEELKVNETHIQVQHLSFAETNFAIPITEIDIENSFQNITLVKEKVNHVQNIKTNSIMNTNLSSFQKIIFGSPGTGKSHAIDGADNSYLSRLGIINKSLDCIKTVFHPEYTYGDFMGKLMPYTNDDGQVEYKFYAGHFLKSLGKAYKNIVLAKIEHEKARDEVEKSYKREINKNNKKEFSEAESSELQARKDAVPAPKPQNVALIIDEINRGNSAAIFGTTFQLLDRDENGWSSYHVRISDLENNELLKEITLEFKEYKKGGRVEEKSYKFNNEKCSETDYEKYIEYIFQDLPENERINLIDRNIKIPANLSIIATMNTSDNSIYFMDSAFKRRWDWEFIDITSDEQKQQQLGRVLEDGFSWDEFVDNLNAFIKKYGERIRKIEDKQVGYFFIKGNVIKHDAIKNKLMFFLWDSIFNNDKKPLKDLIGLDKTMVTFGDFTRHYELFVKAIQTKSFLQNNVL